MTYVSFDDTQDVDSPTVAHLRCTATQQCVSESRTSGVGHPLRRASYSQVAEFSGPRRPGSMDAYSLPSLMHGKQVYPRGEQ